MDTSMMGITDFPGSGRGAVALQDIPVRRSPSDNFCLDWFYSHVCPSGKPYNFHASSFIDTFNSYLDTSFCIRFRSMEKVQIAQGLGWADSLYDVGGSSRESRKMDYISRWVFPNNHFKLSGFFFSTQCTASLPTQFDTPMFWSDEELQELQGTAVVGLSSKFLPFSSHSRL